MGVFGILLATFLARLFTNLWYDPYAVFVYGFSQSPILYLVKYIQYLAVLGIAACVCFVLLTSIHMPIFIQIITKILLCSVICNIVFILHLGKRRSFKSLKKLLKMCFLYCLKENN